MYFNIINSKNDKPITTIILDGKNLKPFPLNTEMMRQGHLLSPVLLNIVLKFLARGIRQEEEIN
jgi:hypothetical protein